MSNKTGKEIECIARLETFVSVYAALLDFLLEEDLISKEERKACTQSQDKAKWLQERLAVLSKVNRLQLLEYEWQILPVERVKIVIVTDRNNREFSYNF